jgi:enoyl-CoA hydratase
MDNTTLLYEKESNIAVIKLNRPKSLNALNRILLRELDTLLDTIEADDEIRAVIITGNEKAFAAGADITELNDIITPTQALVFVEQGQRVFNKIEGMKKPVIAAVSGFAFGGGCELALSCDIRIADESASFALPEIKLGLLPGGGGTQRLPRIVGLGRAKELLFSGDPIDAKEAFRIGLVNKVVPRGSLMDNAKKMAGTFAERPGYTLQTIKGVVNEGVQLDIKSALAAEMRCFALLFSTQDKQEGVKAFVEKREPKFSHN